MGGDAMKHRRTGAMSKSPPERIYYSKGEYMSVTVVVDSELMKRVERRLKDRNLLQEALDRLMQRIKKDERTAPTRTGGWDK
jgi:hypothetical protein